MTEQRMGRHVRIYEWDEVNIDDEETTQQDALQAQQNRTDKKPNPQDNPKGLGALLKKKLF